MPTLEPNPILVNLNKMRGVVVQKLYHVTEMNSSIRPWANIVDDLAPLGGTDVGIFLLLVDVIAQYMVTTVEILQGVETAAVGVAMSTGNEVLVDVDAAPVPTVKSKSCLRQDLKLLNGIKI